MRPGRMSKVWLVRMQLIDPEKINKPGIPNSSYEAEGEESYESCEEVDRAKRFIS